MIKNKYLQYFISGLILIIGLTSGVAYCQESFSGKGYILDVTNNDPALDQTVKQQLVETFFTVYPVLARYYNSNSVKQVTFIIDTAYTGVAEAGGGKVRISPKWLKDHPNDFDLVTHELMHLVQSYPHQAGPWWVTEGIADYVRYIFGVNNALGGWSLPDYREGQNYDNSYRITARFLLWIENKLQPGFVKQLDHAMRTKTYNSGIWERLTGNNVEELWAKYALNPAI